LKIACFGISNNGQNPRVTPRYGQLGTWHADGMVVQVVAVRATQSTQITGKRYDVVQRFDL
jgi:hypothetical protein